MKKHQQKQKLFQKLNIYTIISNNNNKKKIIKKNIPKIKIKPFD